jgi:hypothetical protein
MPPFSNRYLETEFEDARTRIDYNRHRKLVLAKNEGSSDCELCLSEVCGCCCTNKTLHFITGVLSFQHGSLAPLLIYFIFPTFATVDFVLGFVAKSQGWYSHCVGEIVCKWNATVCAVWIALTLSGLLVVIFAVSSRVVMKLGSCCGVEEESHNAEVTPV